jgi:hypothetical protein
MVFFSTKRHFYRILPNLICYWMKDFPRKKTFYLFSSSKALKPLLSEIWTFFDEFELWFECPHEGPDRRSLSLSEGHLQHQQLAFPFLLSLSFLFQWYRSDSNTFEWKCVWDAVFLFLNKPTYHLTYTQAGSISRPIALQAETKQ